jgi:hypothetical protein
MGLFDAVSSFLNPDEGYRAGQGALDKYYKEAQQYYKDAQGNLQPYNQFGKDAYTDYSGAMKRLLNPTALEADWMKNYTESPEAKNATDIATQSGLDAASSMGLMGSNTALNALQGGASKIALNDRSNFLDRLMQKYLAGAGIAGNIFGMGAGAANTMSNNAMTMGSNALNMGQNSANMAYGEQNAPGDMFGKLLGAGLGVAGTALGGPMGGALATRWNLAGGA